MGALMLMLGVGEVGAYKDAYDPCLNYGEVGGEQGEPGHGERMMCVMENGLGWNLS